MQRTCTPRSAPRCGRRRPKSSSRSSAPTRLAQQKKLTAESNREQASAGLDRLTDAELAEFTRLNDTYKAKFGFPFIICARLNAKSAILAAMQTRLPHDAATELNAALTEIEKIAHLRLQDLLKT